MDREQLLKRVVFETVTGSRAYGTYTETSDYDSVGVMVAQKDILYGFTGFEQQTLKDLPGEDRTIYEVRKVLRLIADANPNMMDLLWTPDHCIITMTPYWESVCEKRDLFLSKRIRYTFSGYAIAQLERIKVHRKFLLHPPTSVPTREGYGLPEQPIFPTSQLKAVCYAAMQFIAEEEKPNFIQELDSIYGDYIIPLLSNFLRPEEQDVAKEWLQMGIKAQAKAFGSLGTKYIRDEYIEMAQKEVEFYNASREWARYMDWKKHRNKLRAPLEEKYGFDCYSEDTEFLTYNGWKKFDDISESDTLATVRLEDKKQYKLCTKSLTGKSFTAKQYIKPYGIEYQPYLERFDGLYNGIMYNFVGNHTDIMVTPNHRMLFRPVGKNTHTEGAFILEEATLLPNYFDFLRTVTLQKRIFKSPLQLTDIPLKDTEYMSLMGWYLSEGSVGKRQNKSGSKIKSIRISQKEYGRLHKALYQFHKKAKISNNLYVYPRKPNSFNSKSINEVVLIITERAVVEKIHAECGELKNKRIPRWVFKAQKRLKEILFDSMVLGDGTIRNTSYKSIIYYTSLKNLADDVQELALSCGWETSLYGPYHRKEGGYERDIYHVHVNKNVTQFDRFQRSTNLHKINVKNQRIVCFSVKNGTLITRRKGHIAIQGNCKHASHLKRLLDMGEEILKTGKVNVDRTGIDAEELRAIRNGAWTYEQIEDYAKKKDKEFDELYQTTLLPKEPNLPAIDKLCIQLVDKYLQDNG